MKETLRVTVANTHSKMVHCSETHGDALEATTRSVGCAAALLPRISVKAIATWFRKEKKVGGFRKEFMAVSNQAESNCAKDVPLILVISKTLSDLVDHPPFCQEIESGTACKKDGDVKTPAQHSGRSAGPGVRVANNNTKNDTTTHSKAACDSAAHPPSCLEIGSGTACKKVGDVDTPAPSSGPGDLWARGGLVLD
ncbi:hypothetical protein T484DRAFT_1913806 [Baffinella frigidus]|nr:hypothetical protein T484DRAFT_1913806 [Cryptophyta sp. CCMP2293]